MKVTVNGEEREMANGVTIEELLDSLELPLSGTVVELNGEIVVHSRYGRTALSEGNRLELVRVVAGG